MRGIFRGLWPYITPGGVYVGDLDESRTQEFELMRGVVDGDVAFNMESEESKTFVESIHGWMDQLVSQKINGYNYYLDAYGKFFEHHDFFKRSTVSELAGKRFEGIVHVETDPMPIGLGFVSFFESGGVVLGKEIESNVPYRGVHIDSDDGHARYNISRVYGAPGEHPQCWGAYFTFENCCDQRVEEKNHQESVMAFCEMREKKFCHLLFFLIPLESDFGTQKF